MAYAPNAHFRLQRTIDLEMELRVISYGSQAPMPSLSAKVPSSGLSIGRGGENDLALPDAERLVSRRQARVETDQTGQHVVINISASNSFLVNDHELVPGERIALKFGDEMRMGRFVIAVDDSKAASVERPLISETKAPVASPEHLDFADPLSVDDPLQVFSVATPPTADADPFSDLFESSKPAAQGAAAPVDAEAAPILRLVDGKPPLHPGPLSSVANEPLAGFDGKPHCDDPLGMGQPPLSSDTSDPWFPEPSALPPPTNKSFTTLIPEDFNPFELPSASIRNTADPFAEIARSGQISLEQLIDPGRQPNDLFKDLPGFKAGGIVDESVENPFGSSLLNESTQQDPLALFDQDNVLSEFESEQETFAPLSNHMPETCTVFSIPEAVAQETAPATLPATELIPETPLPVQICAEAQLAAPIAAPVVDDPQTQPSAKSCTEENPAAPLTPAPVAPVDQVTPPPIRSLNEAVLMKAFLAGTGLTEMPPPALTPEFMNLLGQLLASATQGTVDLIQARAATKYELRADVTMIAPRANNPLKFAPDGHSALFQLIGHRFPGFMAPLDAMQDAYDDLRAHQLGMAAGMRAALHDVLERFNPEQIESRLTQPSLLDSMLPQNRKSQLWTLYKDMFEQIKDEAENEFHVIFGKAFLEAYDQEVDRLSRRQA